MTTLDSLKERYQEVKDRCADAARRAGHSPTGVMLVAVSKYAGIDDVRELINLGHRDFGENLVPSLVQRAAMIDEWQSRQKTLPRTKAGAPTPPPAPNPVRWHMIGHLQRNKVKKAVELSRLIHSVDSLRLAEEIQIAANKLARTAEVLIQVNTSGEASKSGCAPAAAGHLVEAIETMINVKVRGLMTMAPHAEGPDGRDATRETFARCRELFTEMRRQGLGGDSFNILSMGMSEDYEIAISEGANLVRVGSAIF
ncbi:MAG TPA: YggS family pyridoxal phosphate-dependent enzyme, partial [Phycisphaerales bacterium]|nr:YggS family pyridoxal phosphate-dependent enzyme [Phycisphaerales bacterium]